jgi:hypothetical protein
MLDISFKLPEVFTMSYFQKCLILTIIGILFFAFFSSALATKYRSIPFIVKGKTIDWDTKKPVSGVTLIIFLNDAAYSANDGWIGKHDYPNFSKTNKDGQFEARTRLYRKNLQIKVKKLEIIPFCPGYRTEKFIIKDPNFSYSAAKHLGFIRDIVLELFETKEH